MAWLADAVYRLALALWVGGVSIFTFLVTPALFRGLGRDAAARTVGLLFPVYFPYVLSVTLVALAAFLARPRAAWDAHRVLCAVLLALAVAASGWSRFWYYPRAAELTREIASFETVAPEHPLRRRFARLHGASMAINLAVLADGVLLLLLTPRPRG